MARSRTARSALSSVATDPQARKLSRLPSIVTTPQPVRRRPGSIPRMRIGCVAIPSCTAIRPVVASLSGAGSAQGLALAFVANVADHGHDSRRARTRLYGERPPLSWPGPYRGHARDGAGA